MARDVQERRRRPAPDGTAADEGVPTPQPERQEPRQRDPGLTDLSGRDWLAILTRAGKETLEDNIPMIASAVAYSTFFAIPSVLLVVLGLFTLFASPATITNLINHFDNVMPHQAVQLIGDSLQRLDRQHRASLALTIVGLVLATWSIAGAMNAYMTAVNIAYDRKDRRNFVKKRLTGLVMAVCIGVAFLLVAAFLILGPHIERWVGNALGMQGFLGYVWWAAQWPVLTVALMAAFATMLWLAPDVDHPRWRFVSPGSLIAVLVWLLASGAFAVYTAKFASYNKTWGSLSAVIVMLMWLWLTGLALLFGAEVNAEAERSRELRSGEPAEAELRAPSRA
jgi:membrane protein